MSKLYDVLEQIIEKVNKSVKFEEGQILTDTEKRALRLLLNDNWRNWPFRKRCYE